MIDQTVTGGIYKDAIGDGYHDANGNPVDAPKVTEQATAGSEGNEGDNGTETANSAPVAPVVVPVADDAPVADPKKARK